MKNCFEETKIGNIVNFPFICVFGNNVFPERDTKTCLKNEQCYDCNAIQAKTNVGSMRRDVRNYLNCMIGKISSLINPG